MWRKFKTIKHYAVGGQARELTFSCYQRAPVFVERACCLLLTRSISDALKTLHYDLLAFVYMPDHVHLLVLPQGDGDDVDALLWRIKQRSALAIHSHLKHTCNNGLLDTLRHVDATGKVRFRLWQAGPGYDRNVNKRRTLSDMIDYIHHNPIRKGLCAYPDEYPWSSWAQLHTPDQPLDPSVPRINGQDNLTL